MTQLTKRERLDKLEEEIRDLLAEDAALEWNGTGLPPVGAECEAVWLEDPDGGSREYEPVFIKGYFGSRSGAQVWFTTREGEDLVVRVGNCSFRPIRSPEEVEQEALKTDLLGILPFCEYTDKQIEEMAQILYVQGYRKPDGEA